MPERLHPLDFTFVTAVAVDDDEPEQVQGVLYVVEVTTMFGTRLDHIVQTAEARRMVDPDSISPVIVREVRDESGEVVEVVTVDADGQERRTYCGG